MVAFLWAVLVCGFLAFFAFVFDSGRRELRRLAAPDGGHVHAFEPTSSVDLSVLVHPGLGVGRGNVSPGRLTLDATAARLVVWPDWYMPTVVICREDVTRVAWYDRQRRRARLTFETSDGHLFGLQMQTREPEVMLATFARFCWPVMNAVIPPPTEVG